jgi:transcriptional regulator with XRE-family HTH domain
MSRTRSAFDPVDVHVGRRLRERRAVLGMSQERLGELLGVTFQQVQKYERGANRIGSSRLLQIGRALDVPVSFFFEGAPETIAAAPGLADDGAPGFDHAGAPGGEPEVDSREVLELARAYGRIADDAVRRRLLDLARALAAATWRA